jgi:hypothetical protein
LSGSPAGRHVPWPANLGWLRCGQWIVLRVPARVAVGGARVVPAFSRRSRSAPETAACSPHVSRERGTSHRRALAPLGRIPTAVRSSRSALVPDSTWTAHRVATRIVRARVFAQSAPRLSSPRSRARRAAPRIRRRQVLRRLRSGDGRRFRADRRARPALPAAGAPGREDRCGSACFGGGAQASDGAVRRRDGVDGARRAKRRGGLAGDHGSLLLDPV